MLTSNFQENSATRWIEPETVLWHGNSWPVTPNSMSINQRWESTCRFPGLLFLKMQSETQLWVWQLPFHSCFEFSATLPCFRGFSWPPRHPTRNILWCPVLQRVCNERSHAPSFCTSNTPCDQRKEVPLVDLHWPLGLHAVAPELQQEHGQHVILEQLQVCEKHHVAWVLLQANLDEQQQVFAWLLVVHQEIWTSSSRSWVWLIKISFTWLMGIMAKIANKVAT